MNLNEELATKRELDKLQLYIIPCSEPIPSVCVKQYEAAYDLWNLVWSKTLFELDGVKQLKSNEFTRHEFLSVIMKDDIAVGLFCYSSINLSLKVRKEDSWFDAWPKELVSKIGRECQNGLMPSWLAVHPDFRRSKSNYPINLGQVVMEIYAKIIIEYGYDMGFGTTRNNRGVNKLILNTGGTKIMSSVDHGVDVDLIQMNPTDILLKERYFSKSFKTLWENRIDKWREKNERTFRETA
ncbi:MAG: hypothetical protein CME66_01015 [Halobacteriovoraceae bacterium]|nr:hypothetical protein [Halobacteriovoraceae bacterium]